MFGMRVLGGGLGERMKDGSRDCHFIFSQADAIKILMFELRYSLRIMR